MSTEQGWRAAFTLLRFPAACILLIGAGVIWSASCLTVQVAAPGPSQAIETDAEKVRRALADLRAIGTALQAYAVDTNKYPRPDASEVAVGDFQFARVDQLSSLPADYRGSLATFDPWGFPYLYWTDGQHWVLICTGSDGRIDDPGDIGRLIQAALSSEWRARPQQTHCLENEIIVMDSHFLTWPANDTRMCSAPQPRTASDPQF